MRCKMCSKCLIATLNKRPQFTGQCGLFFWIVKCVHIQCVYMLYYVCLPQCYLLALSSWWNEEVLWIWIYLKGIIKSEVYITKVIWKMNRPPFNSVLVSTRSRSSLKLWILNHAHQIVSNWVCLLFGAAGNRQWDDLSIFGNKQLRVPAGNRDDGDGVSVYSGIKSEHVLVCKLPVLKSSKKYQVEVKRIEGSCWCNQGWAGRARNCVIAYRTSHSSQLTSSPATSVLDGRVSVTLWCSHLLWCDCWPHHKRCEQ